MSKRLMTQETPARLSRKWVSPIYAFYEPVPEICYHKGRRYHLFTCMGKSCKFQCRRFLDKSDANSTRNLRRHVKRCWGNEVLQAAEASQSVDKAREEVVEPFK